MRSFSFLAALLLAAIFTAPDGMAKVVYFAIRQDGKAGSGSADDPYDGSYANGTSHFDVNMQKVTRDFAKNPLPQGRQNEIRLAQGTYWTWGDDGNYVPFANRGFLLPANTRLTGAGMGRTIVKLVGVDIGVPDGGIARFVITSGPYGGLRSMRGSGLIANCERVTVEDLTVDCNAAKIWPPDANGRPTRPEMVVFGIRLNGSESVVRRVEVLQARAIFPREASAIMINAESDDSQRVLIESCVVEETLGGYVDAICVWPGPGFQHRISGTVRNCVVRNHPWAAFNICAGMDGAETLVEANTTTDVRAGFYWDTASLFNTTLRYNTFVIADIDPANAPRAVALGSYGDGDRNAKPPPVDIRLGGLQILQNYFAVPGNDKGFIHFMANVHLPDRIFSSITIAQNTFASDKPSNQIFALDVDDNFHDVDDRGRYEETYPEIDVTGRFTDIRFGGGNVLQASPSSLLWRPYRGRPSAEKPSRSRLKMQRPDVIYNLPTEGKLPEVRISRGNSYTVRVGEPVRFTVSASALVTLWSPNLPANASTSVPLPAVGLAAGTPISFSWTPAIDQVGKHTISFIGEYHNTGFGVVSVDVLPNPRIQPITWARLENSVPSAFRFGSWVEKALPGVDGAWDAGAISADHIVGDGSISFRFSRTDRMASMGLGSSSPDAASDAAAEFAIVTLPGGNIQIKENGRAVPGSFGTFTMNTVFTMARENGSVSYYKDATLLHTSALSEKHPLFARCDFYSHRSAVFDCTITDLASKN